MASVAHGFRHGPINVVACAGVPLILRLVHLLPHRNPPEDYRGSSGRVVHRNATDISRRVAGGLDPRRIIPVLPVADDGLSPDQVFPGRRPPHGVVPGVEGPERSAAVSREDAEVAG